MTDQQKDEGSYKTIGEVTKEGIKMDGRVLENKGYTHHRVK